MHPFKKNRNNVFIQESFKTNISHQIFDYKLRTYVLNNLCEFTTQEYKFKRWFCTIKPILNVRFKDFLYTLFIIWLTKSINKDKNSLFTQHKF